MKPPARDASRVAGHPLQSRERWLWPGSQKSQLFFTSAHFFIVRFFSLFPFFPVCYFLVSFCFSIFSLFFFLFSPPGPFFLFSFPDLHSQKVGDERVIPHLTGKKHWCFKTVHYFSGVQAPPGRTFIFQIQFLFSPLGRLFLFQI